MLIEEKLAFFKATSLLLELYYQKPSAEVIEVWWCAFQDYEMTDIKKAFDVFLVTSKARPIPALIIEMLPKKTGAHPGPEEAWNRIPKTDFDAGYISDEMTSAMSACSDCIRRGNFIAARMAFIESYKKKLAESILEGRKPVFFYSEASGLSFDERKALKTVKTEEALSLGWISKQSRDEVVAINDSRKIAPKKGQRVFQISDARDQIDKMKNLLGNKSKLTKAEDK